MVTTAKKRGASARRVLKTDAAAVSLPGARAVIVLLALLLVGVSTVVFVGWDAAWRLLPHALAAVSFALMFIAGQRWQGRRLRWLYYGAPLGLSLYAFGILVNALQDSTQLTAATAALVSVPFSVFLAIAATSRLEIGLLLGVAGMHYLAGVWRTPQGPEFPLLFLLGVVTVVGLLVLTTLRHSLRTYLKRHGEREALGLDNATVSGRTPPISLTGALSVLVVMVAFATAALFIVIPRPEALADILPQDSTQLRDDRLPGTQPRPQQRGPGGPSERSRTGEGARMGLDRFLRTEAGTTLLESETPFYRVVAHHGDSRVALDPRHLYLRAAVYDRYDGDTWFASVASESHWQSLRNMDGIRLPLGRALEEPGRNYPLYAEQLRETLGLDEHGRGGERHRIRLDISPTGMDRSDMVPLPRFPLRTSAIGLDYNTYFDTGRRPAWMPEPYSRYVVETFALGPRPDWLDEDVQSTPLAAGHYLALPASRSAYYGALAHEVIHEWEALEGRAVQNDYERALAVLDFFHEFGGFRYSLSSPELTEQEKAAGVSLLEKFLSVSRTGPCTLYAAAATVMLRELGLSARLVAGYHGADFDEDTETHIVRAKHAHAWLEVYFRGYGWFPFDPTPAAQRQATLEGNQNPYGPRNPGEQDDENDGTDDSDNGDEQPGDSDDNGDADENGDGQSGSADETTPNGMPNGGAAGRDRRGSGDEDDDDDGAAAAANNLVGGFTHTTRSDLFAWLAGLFAGLERHATLAWALLLLLASLACFALWYRQAKRPGARKRATPTYRHTPIGEEEARWLNGYERAVARLARLGLVRQPRQTPAEFAGTVHQSLGHHPGAAHAFDRLTEWFYLLRFGHHRLTDHDRSELDHLWATFETDLRTR